MSDQEARRFVIDHFWVAFAAFALACVLGVYQVLERSGIIPAIQSPAGMTRRT
mgnify:CR=1 FL=1